MATYIPTSNNRRDSAPMLYLRDSLPSSYSEAPVLPANVMMYMNYSSSSGSYSDTLAGNSQQPNSCIDIPTVGAPDSNISQQEFLSNIGGTRMAENDFSTWRDGRSEMMLMHRMGGQNLQGGQGLSLSLSPQIPSGIQFHSIQYRNSNLGFSSFLSPNSSISGDGSGNENSQRKQPKFSEYVLPGFPGSNSDSMKADISPHGMSSNLRAISNSKYLKAAQQLLDEVVNVRKAMKQHDSKKELMKESTDVDEESKNGASSNPQESSNSASELSAAEKQDLQNKMTKLLSMLDEVDRRYKQYYHQMQIVVSSFDVIAGCGAAKPYTALALQTISRHFRCLRDGINGQIRVTQKSLGETDASGNGKGVGISRLRYVDQQLRQHRALQQLGMMQQHTWRPQRGLPESSVSILRAWLFEHFLHPYPKDSDKIMLARQTGLTRSQVSNWFINARVRLWKPMVEEMYKEEAGDAEMESNSSSEIAPKTTKGDKKASGNKAEDIQHSAASTTTKQCSRGQFFDLKPNHAHDVDMMGPTADSDFQNDSTFLDVAAAYHHMSELGRFGNGSGVSLTLGIQHCEGGGSLSPMSLGPHHSFVTMRGADDVYNAGTSSVGPETTDFDCMDSGNRHQRFGSSHLLHDFVA